VIISSGPNAGKVLYTPAADYNGPDSFSYTVTDNGTTNGSPDPKSDTNGLVSVTVTEVNDVPSFSKGADQLVLEDAAAQSVSGWATNLSKGPANESGQSLDFLVSNNNNALFSSQPAVSATGTLSFTPAANANG